MADFRRLAELGFVPTLAKEIAAAITAGTVSATALRRLTEQGMLPREIRELRNQLATPAMRSAKRWTEIGVSPRLARELVAQIGGSAPITITRALGNGGRLYPLAMTFGGGSARSATCRYPIRSRGKIYRVKVRLQLFSMQNTGQTVPTFANPYVDTLFPNPLNFQFATKPGYENAVTGLTPRTPFTFSGLDRFEYPGASAWQAANPGKWFIDSDWMTLDGSQLLDMWSSVVVPAGITPNNSIPYNRRISNAMPRGAVGNLATPPGGNSLTDHIAAGYAVNGGVGASPPSTLAMTAVSSTPGVVADVFVPFCLIIETDAGVKTALSAGTSFVEGLSLGTVNDVYNGVPYADAFGDANGNRGAWDAGIYDAGWNYLNVSLPSDFQGRIGDVTAVANAAAGWKNIIADLTFDRIIVDQYNDFLKNGWSGYPGPVAVKVGQTFRGGSAGSGNQYLVVGAGTLNSGTAGPTFSGTSGVTTGPDGTATLMYMGPYVSTSPNALGAFGDAYAFDKVVQALFPGVPITQSLPLPNPTSSNVAISSLAASGTTVTATVASTAILATGMKLAISGASPAAYNGTFTITVVDGTTFTYTAASAPGSSPATGTIVYNDNYQTLANQVPAAQFGTGTTGARAAFKTLLDGNKALLGYDNILDMSSVLENDFANHDGKVPVEVGVPNKILTGAHLNGYSSSLAKVVLTALLQGI